MKIIQFFFISVILISTTVLSRKNNLSKNLNFLNIKLNNFNRKLRSVKATEYKLENKIIRGPLIPINEYILVEKNESFDTTDSGVYIGDIIKKNQYVGKVLSVGTGVINPQNGQRIPIDIEVNDIVIFNPSDGNKIKYNDKECLLISNEEILGKLKNSNEVNPFNIIPLYDRVLIKLVKQTANKDSLVLLPESKNDEKINEGLVIAIGDGNYDYNNKKISIDINRNDFIKFSPFSNETCEFTYQNEKYTFVKYRYIMAKY